MERAGARATSAGVVCAIAVSLTVVLIFQAYWWTALVSGAVAAATGWRFLNARAAGYQQWRLKQLYERAVKRVQGDWAGKGSAGEAWDDPNHAYAHDLNLFGQGSLFELLSIGRSGIGQHGLANCILTPVTIEQTRARQEAVRELRDRADLREQIALLGPHTFSESSWETFTDWLESPAITFPRALAPVLLITSVVLGCLALGAVGAGGTLLPWIWLFRLALPLVVFHAVVGLWFQERVKAAIASVGNLSSETQVLREGLELLEREPFQSPLLKQLAASAHGGAHALRKLERLLKGLRERNQDWFLHVSRLLMIGTQLSFAIEKWRRRHGSGVQAWMEAWAEFEALNALGGYAHENPDNIFPEFVDGGPRFEALALGHPLLSRDACIRNDVELNPGCRFYIVSGSNMSGKSTLLRSIGQNAVLAAGGSSGTGRSFAVIEAGDLCLAQCRGFAIEWKIEVPGGGGTPPPGHRDRSRRHACPLPCG